MQQFIWPASATIWRLGRPLMSFFVGWVVKAVLRRKEAGRSHTWRIFAGHIALLNLILTALHPKIWGKDARLLNLCERTVS